MKTTEWISIKDRLPKLRQRINARFGSAQVTDKYVTGISYDRDIDGNFGCTIYFDCIPHHITHWQPFPESPKEEPKHECYKPKGMGNLVVD